MFGLFLNNADEEHSSVFIRKDYRGVMNTLENSGLIEDDGDGIVIVKKYYTNQRNNIKDESGQYQCNH